MTSKTRFGCKVGRKPGAYNPATGTTVKWVNRVVAVNINDPGNCYNVLGINKDEEKDLEDSHNELIKFINISAGIGGEF